MVANGNIPKREWSYYATREALRVLESNLTITTFAPTKWQRTRWRVTEYFGTLWDALCGRRRYD